MSNNSISKKTPPSINSGQTRSSSLSGILNKRTTLTKINSESDIILKQLNILLELFKPNSNQHVNQTDTIIEANFVKYYAAISSQKENVSIFDSNIDVLSRVIDLQFFKDVLGGNSLFDVLKADAIVIINSDNLVVTQGTKEFIFVVPKFVKIILQFLLDENNKINQSKLNAKISIIDLLKMMEENKNENKEMTIKFLNSLKLYYSNFQTQEQQYDYHLSPQEKLVILCKKVQDGSVNKNNFLPTLTTFDSKEHGIIFGRREGDYHNVEQFFEYEIANSYFSKFSEEFKSSFDEEFRTKKQMKVKDILNYLLQNDKPAHLFKQFVDTLLLERYVDIFGSDSAETIYSPIRILTSQIVTNNNSSVQKSVTSFQSQLSKTFQTLAETGTFFNLLHGGCPPFLSSVKEKNNYTSYEFTIEEYQKLIDRVLADDSYSALVLPTPAGGSEYDK